MGAQPMQNLHVVALFFFYLAGTCIVAHVALSFLLRVNIAFRDPVSDQVFGSPNQFVMRPRFFWPWTPSPSGLAARSMTIQVLFLGARVSGVGVLLGFIGALFLAAMNFLVAR